MKLLIDTNMVLDVLLARNPFCGPAEQVLGLSQREDVEEYVSASAITDIYYIAHRQLKDRDLTKNRNRKRFTALLLFRIEPASLGFDSGMWSASKVVK